MIEMLTTVAALVIVFGLMVSLARHVRNSSGDVLTKRLMLTLEMVMEEYHRGPQKGWPAVPPLVTNSNADENALQRAALENNLALVKALRQQCDLPSLFKDLPSSVYDEVTLRDAWGSPIVFMPPGAKNIGSTPQERAFFLSAGPDRRFRTREDDLISYEAIGGR